MTVASVALSPELLGKAERYAVYRCFSDGGVLLYIGSTGHLGKRLASHAEKVWFQQVRGITLEWYADELDALNAERRAIHVEHPKYNVQHRNGKSPQRKPQRQTSIGRAMSAEELADYARQHLGTGMVPSINALMRLASVDREKAKDAHDILKLTHWAGDEGDLQERSQDVPQAAPRSGTPGVS